LRGFKALEVLDAAVVMHFKKILENKNSGNAVHDIFAPSGGFGCARFQEALVSQAGGKALVQKVEG
jgi:hypothetical protein